MLLEEIGRSFIRGYNCALGGARQIRLAVDREPAALAGFVAEGAAMGAAVRSAVFPWRKDLAALLETLQADYAYLTHVGVGWAMARLPFSRRRMIHALDPVLSPLATDGRGFHDGYFHPGRVLSRPNPVRGTVSKAAYDQGVGRSLWFVCCARPELIASAIASADRERADDLWSGVGLAAAYAGGVEEQQLDELLIAARGSQRWLSQGAAFGVAAHARARIMPPHADLAAYRMCGVAASSIPSLVEAARRDAVAELGAAPPAYAAWRGRVAEKLSWGCQ